MNKNLYREQRESARRRSAELQAQLRERIAAEAERRDALNAKHREWQEADAAARAEATVIAGDPPKPSLNDIRRHRR